MGALVISPTRELALQTWEVLKKFLNYTYFSHALLVGGNPVEDDIHQLKMQGGNIIIATPGRFEDLLTRQKNCNITSAIKSLVSIRSHIILLGSWPCRKLLFYEKHLRYVHFWINCWENDTRNE